MFNKQLTLVFIIKCVNFSEFFIYFFIITWLIFSLFNLFQYPFFEFHFFSVFCSIDSEIKILLTFPEIYRIKSFFQSHTRPQMLLILIIIVRYIWFVACCLSVLIQNILAKIHILKHEFSTNIMLMTIRKHTLPKSMYQPFWLKRNFQDNREAMVIRFCEDFIKTIQSPGSVVLNISIKPRFIINSSLSPRQQTSQCGFLCISYKFFSFFYFFEI